MGPRLLCAPVQTAGAEGEAGRSRLQQLTSELEEARRREQVGCWSRMGCSSACLVGCFAGWLIGW